jgi:SnoaL-like domain
VTRGATFGRAIDVWSVGDPEDILALITVDYVGHMLHLENGQRSAQDYPGWIQSFREANPNTAFVVQDQSSGGDRLWSRLQATRGDGAVSHGMNVSRFAGDRVAEEWALWSAWMFP